MVTVFLIGYMLMNLVVVFFLGRGSELGGGGGGGGKGNMRPQFSSSFRIPVIAQAPLIPTLSGKLLYHLSSSYPDRV